MHGGSAPQGVRLDGGGPDAGGTVRVPGKTADAPELVGGLPESEAVSLPLPRPGQTDGVPVVADGAARVQGLRVGGHPQHPDERGAEGHPGDAEQAQITHTEEEQKPERRRTGLLLHPARPGTHPARHRCTGPATTGAAFEEAASRVFVQLSRRPVVVPAAIATAVVQLQQWNGGGPRPEPDCAAAYVVERVFGRAFQRRVHQYCAHKGDGTGRFGSGVGRTQTAQRAGSRLGAIVGQYGAVACGQCVGIADFP